MGACPRFGTALFDIKNAYPSVLHKYAWVVLKKLNLPNHVRRAIRAPCAVIRMSISFHGRELVFIQVTRGVKPGCPIS
eukprot:4868505-Pyramimonas_sp.AAC.1